jgi:hypothetical protein
MIADGRVCGPMRNQSPVHKPALVAALMSENDGNRRRSLFGGNVKARRVLWQVAAKVPASPNVTELERSREATAHLKSRAIGDRWQRRFFGLFLLRFLCDRLRGLYDLARTPK